MDNKLTIDQIAVGTLIWYMTPIHGEYPAVITWVDPVARKFKHRNLFYLAEQPSHGFDDVGIRLAMAEEVAHTLRRRHDWLDVDIILARATLESYEKQMRGLKQSLKDLPDAIAASLPRSLTKMIGTEGRTP